MRILIHLKRITQTKSFTFLAHNGEFEGVDEFDDDEFVEPVGEITFDVVSDSISPRCSALAALFVFASAMAVFEEILMLIDLEAVVVDADCMVDIVVVVVVVVVDEDDAEEQEDEDEEVGDMLLAFTGENMVSSESSMFISTKLDYLLNRVFENLKV